MSRRDLRILALLVVIALALAVVIELVWHPLSGYSATPQAGQAAVTAPPISETPASAAPQPAGTEANPDPDVPAHFGEIHFGTGVGQDGPLNPSVTFAPETRIIYAQWTYENMTGGTPYRLAWYRDAGLYLDQPDTWDVARHGTEGPAYVAYLTGRGGDDLPPGNYRLELYLGERLAQMATFEVQALTPTPTAIATPPQATATARPDRQAAGYEAARSLVFVVAPGDDDEDYSGSGSIVDGPQGLILTNWHVVGDIDTGRTYNDLGYAVTFVDGDPRQPHEQAYIAFILDEYSDPALDLALLQIVYVQTDGDPEEVTYPLDLPSITLGDSDEVLLGDGVVVLGYPDYAQDSLSWTEGVVSVRIDDWIISDVEASQGNSGGMMLDELGKLIAIPTEVRETEVGAVLTWARPANLALPLIEAALDSLSEP